MTIHSKDNATFSAMLLSWYDKNARTLPWRIPPHLSKLGQRSDPYHVWLSEIMLQQTQVATVIPYYEKFLALWPTLADLANAPLDDVLRAWAGLGYYSRARNLKKCAEEILARHNGNFPESSAQLVGLPGIGTYTSAAIAAIAFGQHAGVVDGNVERVFTRVFELTTPLPKVKTQVANHVKQVLDAERPGDFAQATMDLGATVCMPKTPRCELCPISTICLARKKGTQESFPVRLPKKKKPVREGAAYLLLNQNKEVLIVKRQEKGLLGGMSALPSSDWNAREDGNKDISGAPISAPWRNAGVVKHVFTHFTLHLHIYVAQLDAGENCHISESKWVHQSKVLDEAFPSLMKKAIKQGMLELKAYGNDTRN